MPTPTTPISVKIKNTNLSAGEYVKIVNLTNGGSFRGKVNSSGELIMEAADSGLTSWANGDAIQIESSGRIPFLSTGTITKNTLTKISSVSTADTSTPAVSI